MARASGDKGGVKEGAKRREQYRESGASSEFGVLKRDDVEELAATVTALTDWVRRLQWLCESLNDRLCIMRPGTPPKALSFYSENPRVNREQVPLFNEAFDAIVKEDV